MDSRMQGSSQDTRSVSFLLWVVPFDLWRCNRVIRRMENEGFQLEHITPPSFPGPQRLTMEFSRANDVKRSKVRYHIGRLRPNGHPGLAGWKVIGVAVDDVLWIPFGHFYFLREKG